MSGILSNWTREEYESNTDRVRSTRMKDMIGPQGPRAYYFNHVAAPAKRVLASRPGLDQPKIDDLILGILFHTFLFEDTRDWFRCGERYGTRAWKDAIDDNEGRWAVKAHHHDMLIGMRDGVNRNKDAVNLITDTGFAEQTFLFEKDGIKAKARGDLFHFNGTIVDLKTSRYCSRTNFEKQIRELKYDFSAAFYEQARNAVPEFEGMRANFIHIVVFKEPPYYCYTWPLDPSYLRVGHSQVDLAFLKLRECLDAEERILEEGGKQIDAWPDWQEAKQSDSSSAPVYYLAQHGFNEETW